MRGVAAHPRRLASDHRMFVGESDSYAGPIGRPDRDDERIARHLDIDRAAPFGTQAVAR